MECLGEVNSTSHHRSAQCWVCPRPCPTSPPIFPLPLPLPSPHMPLPLTPPPPLPSQYYMFYDVGASSTVATIAEYKIVQSKERGVLEKVPQLTIKVHIQTHTQTDTHTHRHTHRHTQTHCALTLRVCVSSASDHVTFL